MMALTDLRYVVRIFFKNFLTSLLGVFIFALGLSMSVSMFALVKGMLWSYPDVKNGHLLTHVEWDRPQANVPTGAVLVPDYRAFRDENNSFEQLVGFQFGQVAVNNPEGEAYTTRYSRSFVSENFFQVIQVKPILGRLPTAEDASPDTPSVVAISATVWQEQFGGSPDVIGSSVLLNGMPHIIVAVMPTAFQFPAMEQMWVPTTWAEMDSRQRGAMPRLEVFGILKEGVTVREAHTDLQRIAVQLERDFPATNKNHLLLELKPYNQEFTEIRQQDILHILLTCSLLVLLIACANVSNLVLVRISKRQHELGVRKSLGASRKQLMKIVLLDGLLLAGGGLIFGLLFAFWISRFIWHLMEQTYPFLPYWWNMDLDLGVILFAATLMVVCVILSSLVPAIRATSKQAIDTLKDDTRTSSNLFIGRLAKLLIAVQVTFSTVLLITAISMVLSNNFLNNRKLPYDPENILTTRLQLSLSAGFNNIESVHQFYDNLSEKLTNVRDVERVGFSYNYAGYFPSLRPLEIENNILDREQDRRRISTNIVTKGYFSVYDLQPLSGRLFIETDVESAQHVAIVNRHFVNLFFPDENPIGQRIRVNNPGTASEVQNRSRSSTWTNWMTIVGVVPNVQPEPLPGENFEHYAEIYIPTKQRPSRGLNLLLRSSVNPLSLVEDVRRIIRQEAPLLAPQTDFETIRNVIDRSTGSINITSNIITAFGIAALVMASIGLYALLSFTTVQRQREFGIRVALGASTKKITVLVGRQVFVQVMLGLILGCSIGYFLSGTLQQVFGNTTANLPVKTQAFSFSVALILIPSLIAILVPSVRTAKKAPSVSLRSE